MEQKYIEIVHKLNKQLVIRVGQCTIMKAKIVDRDNKTVGRLMKIFGPVTNPYGLVSLNEEIAEPEKLTLEC